MVVAGGSESAEGKSENEDGCNETGGNVPRKRWLLLLLLLLLLCNQLITKQHRAFMSRQNPQNTGRPPRAPRQFPCFQRPVLGRSSTRTNRSKQET